MVEERWWGNEKRLKNGEVHEIKEREEAEGD